MSNQTTIAPTKPSEETIGCFHGGQSWKALGDLFKTDMSVTTNALKAPQQCIEAAKPELDHVHHYPLQDSCPARKALGKYLKYDPKNILLGNGASELIGLAMLNLPAGGWRPGPYVTQYKEYERMASVINRKKVAWEAPESEFSITVIVRPSSPTGHFMDIQTIEKYLNESKSIFICDESFLPFLGPDWLKESAIQLIPKYKDRLVVIQSWTKIWSCPGLRIGSVSTSEKWIKKFSKFQVPWSVNSIAQKFLEACCDPELITPYMEKTWSTIRQWRKNHEKLLENFPNWKISATYSPEWVPWLYVDTGSEKVAEQCLSISMKLGIPIRWCKSYGTPTCIRIGIREPEFQMMLTDAWLEDPIISPK